MKLFCSSVVFLIIGFLIALLSSSVRLWVSPETGQIRTQYKVGFVNIHDRNMPTCFSDIKITGEDEQQPENWLLVNEHKLYSPAIKNYEGRSLYHAIIRLSQLFAHVDYRTALEAKKEFLYLYEKSGDYVTAENSANKILYARIQQLENQK